MNDSTSEKIDPVIAVRAAADGGPRPVVVPAGLAGRPDIDQLSRIEEKAARIEEKFARSETLLLRVQATFEDAMAEFGGLARSADIAAIEQSIRRVPGFGGLLIVGILAAILGAALTIAALKYGIPGVLPAGSLPAGPLPK